MSEWFPSTSFCVHINGIKNEFVVNFVFRSVERHEPWRKYNTYIEWVVTRSSPSLNFNTWMHGHFFFCYCSDGEEVQRWNCNFLASKHKNDTRHVHKTASSQYFVIVFFFFLFSHIFRSEIFLFASNRTVIHIKTIRSQLKTEQVLNFLFSHIVFFSSFFFILSQHFDLPFHVYLRNSPNAISELRNAFLFIFVLVFFFCFNSCLVALYSMSHSRMFLEYSIDVKLCIYTIHSFIAIWLIWWAMRAVCVQRFQLIVFISWHFQIRFGAFKKLCFGKGEV